MKKNNVFFMALIFCTMLLASCAAPRTYAPYALSTVSTVSLPALQHSLERKDYEILDTIKAEAVVHVSSSKKGYTVKPESNEFVNVCNMTDTGIMYNIAESKGTIRYGFIENLKLEDPNPCDGSSMASGLAAYRLINEVKATDADGIVAPSLYVTAEEVGTGIFSRTIVYKVVISAKLIKLKTQN